MEESGQETDSETDYSGSETEDTYDEYNEEYSYYRDESDVEELVRTNEQERTPSPYTDYPSPLYQRCVPPTKDAPSYFRRDPPSEEDAPYCERAPRPTSLHEPPVLYAPERGPPLLDFLFVLTAFVAAVFAAYYSIFTAL